MLLIAAIAFGCERKQEIIKVENPAYHAKTEPASSEISDETLIEMIGAVQADTQEDLMETLLDNAALSEDVLKAVVDNPDLNDNFVELCFIVSAPTTALEVEYLQIKRPGFNTANIAAANETITPEQTFTVMGAPIMKVTFAPDLERQVLDDCADGECSSKLYSPSGQLTQIGWGSNDGVVFAKNCNPNKWICGTLKRQTLCGADGVTVCVINVCESSNEKCMRLLIKPHERFR